MNRFKFNVTSDFIVNSLCAITISTGVVEYSANIFFNKSYVKYFKEAYKNNEPVALSESLRKRYNDVIFDIKYTDYQKAFSIPFTADGYNPVNVGCLNTRTGCYIGIPRTYDLSSIDDLSLLNDTKLQEFMQLFNDKSESGQQFIESLILSEPAKKYSIAREIFLTDNMRIFIKSISFSVILLPMYILGNTMLKALPAKKIKIKALTFFLLCNVGVFIWLLTRVVVENFFQNEADKIVANINEDYTRGGIEYYQKLIQRNLALRNILPNGKNMYSEQGNKLAFISVFSPLPLTYRKKHLEYKLEKYLKENNDKST